MDSGNSNLETLRNEDEAAFMERAENNLNKLEEVRQEKLKTYITRKKIGIPLALVLGPVCAAIDGFLLTIQSGSDDPIAGLTVVVLGGLYAWVTSPKKQYNKAYKRNILPRLAHMMGMEYHGYRKIAMNAMRDTKIVPKHDRYTAEDYFRGRYKGVDLEFSEIKLETEHRGKNGSKYYRTKFKGLAILLQIDKKSFFGHTIMLRNSNKLMEWFKEKTTKLDKANLVDPEFEKIFDAYTNDQTEARYLVDPAMIENLKTLYTEYQGNKMMVAYHENSMLIMIASKHNHFEPASIYTKATDPESFRAMMREIKQILSVIDLLDLYDPIAWQQEKQKNAIHSAQESSN
ncbi:MAG TPA: DUF3137 domain-containing protein [Micavibrio sp.]|nr:DUF3137 domain-containing protein [Micavibrio sp.]HIL29446.1 DUF3137 domain-containing protein [Micavibrio sp.]